MSDKIKKVYAAESAVEQQAAYDDWSAGYERDLMAMGYRAPWFAAAAFARHVDPSAAPILDAGCGGGLQAEALALLGYGPIVGLDLSEGMLSVARAKGIYADLRMGALGAKLDFPDDAFGAVISVGTITPGHAPAESFVGLARVARPGAPVVVSLRCDEAAGPDYWAVCTRLEAEGRWRRVFSSDPFPAMPEGEPDVLCKAHVFFVA